MSLNTSEAQCAAPRGTQYYKSVVFRSTHNSYSGDIVGRRGTITEQLNAGVRFIEFDIYNPASPGGSYRIGHSRPGHEVWRSGDNPRSDNLEDWLRVVGDWARAHPEAAPITVGIDMKSSLSASESAAHGGFANFNQLISTVFGGGLLLTPEEFGEKSEDVSRGPTIDALRGRVLVVLSGDDRSRYLYGWDEGCNPAVAMNDSGWIVEVHNSNTWPSWRHELWYWTGRLQSDGTVKWLHHGRYDRGTTPAVAINNNGVVVEVHKSGSNSGLWCRVGQLSEQTGDIVWSGSSERYDRGVTPAVEFESLDGNRLREIHASQNQSNQNWIRTGSLNSRAGGVDWGGNGKTRASLFDKDTARTSAATVTVSAPSAPSADGLARTSCTLLYTAAASQSPNSASRGRIAYPQLAFLEFQDGNLSALLEDGVIFHANKARYVDWIARQRAQGHVVRQWAFNTTAHATVPPSSFPATDYPYESWYNDEFLGTVETAQ